MTNTSRQIPPKIEVVPVVFKPSTIPNNAEIPTTEVGCIDVSKGFPKVTIKEDIADDVTDRPTVNQHSGRLDN
jgi:hypothetical protein